MGAQTEIGFVPRDTLAEARARVKECAEDGCLCPCCGQRVQLYRRKLTGTMGAILIGLVRVYFDRMDWIHVRDIPLHGGDARVAGGDLGKMQHWKLVFPCANEDPRKRASGLWKPTGLGMDFVFGRVRVPKYVFLLRNELQGTSDDNLITIRDTLGDRFDYAALMAGLMERTVPR